MLRREMDAAEPTAEVKAAAHAAAAAIVTWSSGGKASWDEMRQWLTPAMFYKMERVVAAINLDRAARTWTKITASPKSLPAVDQTVLVRLRAAGPTYDVVVYRGKGLEGEHRWILGNVELQPRMITHWAEICPLEEEDD